MKLKQQLNYQKLYILSVFYIYSCLFNLKMGLMKLVTVSTYMKSLMNVPYFQITGECAWIVCDLNNYRGFNLTLLPGSYEGIPDMHRTISR